MSSPMGTMGSSVLNAIFGDTTCFKAPEYRWEVEEVPTYTLDREPQQPVGACTVPSAAPTPTVLTDDTDGPSQVTLGDPQLSSSPGRACRGSASARRASVATATVTHDASPSAAP
jgi:hypothetical protein